MFNYKEATLEELVEKVLTTKRAAVHSAKRYYAEKGDYDVVSRIDKARMIASVRKLQQKIEEKTDVSCDDTEGAGANCG